MKQKMKKRDLKTGMVIVNSNNSVGEVMLGTSHGDIIIWYENRVTGESLNKYRKLDTVNEDLSFRYGAGRIVEVWKPKNERSYVLGLDAFTKIYEDKSDDAMEVNMAEVERKFGRKVKIVK